jgi:hypothetical protein
MILNSFFTGMHLLSYIFSHQVFHYNTFLSVQLGSPHFKSGLKLEPFEIMVMHHRNENLTRFVKNHFALYGITHDPDRENPHAALPLMSFPL